MTKEELFNKNTKLAYYFANKYRMNYPHEYEDIKQVALMGLWKAVSKYDGRARLSTFASIVIQNEINIYLRNVKKHDNIDHLEQEVSEKITLADMVASDKDELEELESLLDQNIAKESLNVEVLKLSARDQEIYKRLIEGETQCEIATKVGLKQAQISRIKNKIIKNARLAMKGT